MNWKNIVVYKHKKGKHGGYRYEWPFKLPKKEIPITLEFDDNNTIGHASNFKIVFKKITVDIDGIFPKRLNGAIVLKIDGERKKNIMSDNKVVGISLVANPIDKNLIGNYLK